MKRHIQTIHEGHKDYKCESCGKLFSQVGNLNKHIHTIHEGRKDYKCPYCDQNFAHKYVLEKHIQIVHKLQTSEKPNSNPSHPCLPNDNSTTAYIKNPNYVRKRKPIDFTIDDIAADAEGIDDKTIISNFQFDEKMTKRSLPKRNCKDKNILYNNPEEDQKSSEDEIVSEDPNNSIDENLKPDQIEMFNDKNVHLVPEEESKLKNLTEKNTSNTNNQHLCKEKNCIKLVTGRRNLINHYKIAHRLSKKIIGKPLKNIPSSLLKY